MEAHLDREAICSVIGRNIRHWRLESGISETGLAFYLDITLKQLEQYENGNDSPTCDELIQISRVFGCSVDDLCSDAT